jgi:hypothetical protein
VGDHKVTTDWREAPKVCYYCEKEGHIKRDCEDLKLSIELRRIQREKRSQKNKNNSNSALDFSEDNPYTSKKTTEVNTDANRHIASDRILTTPVTSEDMLTDLPEKNLTQENLTSNNAEVQEQTTSETSSALENTEAEKLDPEQNSEFMEINSDSDSKEDAFTVITSKKSRNKLKKKEQDLAKTTGPLRKKDLPLDNNTKSGRHQEY